MSVWISEYATAMLYGRGTPGIPGDYGANTTVLSSATTSTFILSTTTRMVRITCDAACWVLFSGSSISTSIATTTNCGRIAPSIAPEYRTVTPGSRVTVLST